MFCSSSLFTDHSPHSLYSSLHSRSQLQRQPSSDLRPSLYQSLGQHRNSWLTCFNIHKGALCAQLSHWPRSFCNHLVRFTEWVTISSSWQNHILRKERNVPLSDIIFGDTICWGVFTAHLTYKLLWKKIISGLVSPKAQSSLTLNSIILVQKVFCKNTKNPSSLVWRNWNWGFTQKWNYLTPILQTDNHPSEAIFLFWIFLVIFFLNHTKYPKEHKVWNSARDFQHLIFTLNLICHYQVQFLFWATCQNHPRISQNHFGPKYDRDKTVPESVFSNIDVCPQQPPAKQNI